MNANKYLILIIVTFLTVSCKTSQLSIQVLKPAQITLPSDVKTIAVVNRSLPEKKERLRNVIEGAITGEAVFADRLGSEECVKGVIDGLSGSPRLKGIIPTGVNIRGTGTRQFPDPLSWNTVDDICKASGADALACLEVFDSDCINGMSDRKITRKEKDKEITYIEYTARLDVNVVSGWRIYFPAERKLIDQNIYNDSKGWVNTSDAPKKAQQGLIRKDEAVSQSGFYAGNQFAIRISPLWIWVRRTYFSKGNSEFEQAKRLVQVNDWKGASDLWMKHVKNADPKIAGYACYNMALACEMDGNLETAIDWAKKSYTDYQNKYALSYMRILEQRLNDQYRLDEQMKEVQ
jgi:hypothetical protein